MRGDADRKRLEYVLERWSGFVSVRKVCAGTLIVDADPERMLRFVDDLLSRFDREAVSVWSLTEPDFTLNPLTLERRFSVAEAFKDVWGVVNFVMSKFKGVLISESLTGASRVYRVRSKYGVATVRFEVLDVGGRRFLTLRVEGFGKAVPHVFNRLVREISYIEGGEA